MTLKNLVQRQGDRIKKYLWIKEKEVKKIEFLKVKFCDDSLQKCKTVFFFLSFLGVKRKQGNERERKWLSFTGPVSGYMLI